MSFVYPAGLWGLIGIPVLVLIYIILNKYTEQTVTSTYLWTLSERFLKRRNPISMIANIVSLILQIVVIVLISLAIARPIIVIPNSANAYCFVLDGSGSMNMTQNGKSRFEVAKGEIAGIIKNSMNGSTYTLVLAGDAPQTVYAGLDSKDRAIEILGTLNCSHSATPLSAAMNLAQRYFDENPSILTYIVTDTLYDGAENATLINVYTDVRNFGLSEVEYEFTNGLTVTGLASSYEGADVLTVELYFDEDEEPYATQRVDVDEFEQVPFEFLCKDVVDFHSLKLVIPESDQLKLDNEIIIYNVRYENISDTLLVSDEPFFLRAALTSAGNTQFQLITTEQYSADNTYKTGYGLYIFDNFMPDALPHDGAVWFINPQDTLQGTNFNYQGVSVPRLLAKYSPSTSTFVRGILQGVSKTDFQLAKFSKLGLSGKFNTIVSCENNPVLFTGVNANGYREVVFAFDLRDSAGFTLHSDFTTLVGHLLDYSFPSIIDTTTYFSGDIMQINVITGCESIIVTSPKGTNSYHETSSDIVEYQVTDVGLYKITAVMKDQPDRICNVYASLPEEERTPYVEGDVVKLLGTPDNKKSNGIYDTLFIIFIILAVIALADYGVYCYEQYQLR